MQPAPEPRHREVRKWRMEADEVITEEYETADGATATVTYPGSESSVCEQYCAHCMTWVEVRGVIGGLRFMARHDSGDCTGGLQ